MPYEVCKAHFKLRMARKYGGIWLQVVESLTRATFIQFIVDLGSIQPTQHNSKKKTEENRKTENGQNYTLTKPSHNDRKGLSVPHTHTDTNNVNFYSQK